MEGGNIEAYISRKYFLLGERLSRSDSLTFRRDGHAPWRVPCLPGKTGSSAPGCYGQNSKINQFLFCYAAIRPTPPAPLLVRAWIRHLWPGEERREL